MDGQRVGKRGLKVEVGVVFVLLFYLVDDGAGKAESEVCCIAVVRVATCLIAGSFAEAFARLERALLTTMMVRRLLSGSLRT